MKGVWKRFDALILVLVLVVLGLLIGRCTDDSEFLKLPDDEATESNETQLAPPPVVVTATEPLTVPTRERAVRFLMYNVENYFVEGDVSRSQHVSRPKRVADRDAVADVIASVKPAIVGLVEMGGEEAVKDLVVRLRKRGLSYPYHTVLEREGEDRALALISSCPIVQNNSRRDYGLFGDHRRRMLRGILDVTVKTEDGRHFRVLGAHLKSRVAQDAEAANTLRAREARTLAMYVQNIVRQQPGMPLVVYGDWNDGPQDAALGILSQGTSADAALTRLEAKDSRGEQWTLFYKARRQYYVFDQIYVNDLLKQRMGKDYKSGVIDIPATRRASDHRSVWADLR